MEILNCQQGTAEWFRARMGLPTASEFATVMKKGRGNAENQTRKTYKLRLAGEILTEEPPEEFYSMYTARGKELEPEARRLYAFMTDESPTQIGFIKNHGAGCSPDSLIGDAGLLEIKTKKPEFLIDVIMKDEFPEDHKAQCQGALWVSGREWIDIAVYWPGLPLFVKRAYRDEEFIKDLAAEVARFNEELATVVETVRHYGMKEAA